MAPKPSRLKGLVDDLDTAIVDLNDPNVRLYFDTADVCRAVLGAFEYIKYSDDSSMTVNREAFDSQEALAGCLLSSGFIGPFSMLPPHQAEFLRLISREEVFVRRPLQITDAQFLRQVGIQDPWGSKITADSGEEDIKNYLLQYAGRKTETFFKAIQCIRMPWWDRLEKMRKEDIFQFSGEGFDFDKIQRNEYLPQILTVLEKLRGNFKHDHALTRNNLNDAFCLLMLVELARRHRNSESAIIPRFYDPTGWFYKIARITGLHKELRIKSGLRSRNVFVSTKYLIYRASLRASDFKNERFGELLQSLPLVAELPDNGNDAIAPPSGYLPPLRSNLQTWLNLNFLKNVWLESLAPNELRHITERWRDESKLSEYFLETVKRTIKSATKDVLCSAGEFKRFISTWSRLNEEIRSWKSKILNHLEADSIRADLMLLRISPDEKIGNRIRADLDALAGDGDASSKTPAEARHELFSRLNAFLRADATHRSSTIETRDVEYLAGSLWSIGADRWLLESFRHQANSRRSFFVSAVCAAAALSVGRDTRWAQGMISWLDSKIRKGISNDPGQCESDMRRNSTLAYLWFHLWTANWNRGAWWRQLGQDDADSIRANAEPFISNAILRAELAWQSSHHCSSSDPNIRERAIYVANQRLYYLVEQGAPERVDDIEAAYEIMVGYRTDSRYHWKPTYADTIARYFAFLAERSDSEESWKKCMKHAIENFNSATDAENTNVKKSFDEYLTRAQSAGFHKNARNTGRGWFAFVPSNTVMTQ